MTSKEQLQYSIDYNKTLLANAEEEKLRSDAVFRDKILYLTSLIKSAEKKLLELESKSNESESKQHMGVRRPNR